ncbi:MAG: ribosome-binding factor A [Deltaproteobacteria bacterium HGW-Deltaproteobacteria-14]|jgi:ribosome-binding factor A|nr:MAG: ribosome-binding factor A [Deltaproteobacteria bacterium HGW-Deltaproteobacteria-14]
MARKRPFRRTDRLASQIQQVLAVAVQRESRMDDLHGVVITGVDVTSDLSLARVHYYLMSGDPEAVAAALEKARGFLRRRVGEEIRARVTPELRFLVDKSIDHGRRIEEILRDLDIPPAEDEDEADVSAEGDDEEFDAAAYDGDDDDEDDLGYEAEELFDEEEAFDEDDGLFHEETDGADVDALDDDGERAD